MTTLTGNTKVVSLVVRSTNHSAPPSDMPMRCPFDMIKRRIPTMVVIRRGIFTNTGRKIFVNETEWRVKLALIPDKRSLVFRVRATMSDAGV